MISTNETNGMDYLMTTEEVAEVLKRSRASIFRDRVKGDGPPVVRIGGSVRYRSSDVAKYITNHLEVA